MGHFGKKCWKKRGKNLKICYVSGRAKNPVFLIGSIFMEKLKPWCCLILSRKSFKTPWKSLSGDGILSDFPGFLGQFSWKIASSSAKIVLIRFFLLIVSWNPGSDRKIRVGRFSMKNARKSRKIVQNSMIIASGRWNFEWFPGFLDKSCNFHGKVGPTRILRGWNPGSRRRPDFLNQTSFTPVPSFDTKIRSQQPVVYGQLSWKKCIGVH